MTAAREIWPRFRAADSCWRVCFAPYVVGCLGFWSRNSRSTERDLWSDLCIELRDAKYIVTANARNSPRSLGEREGIMMNVTLFTKKKLRKRQNYKNNALANKLICEGCPLLDERFFSSFFSSSFPSLLNFKSLNLGIGVRTLCVLWVYNRYLQHSLFSLTKIRTPLELLFCYACYFVVHRVFVVVFCVAPLSRRVY